MTPTIFDYLKVGDTVLRMLAGVIPIRLTVTQITDTEIVCGRQGWRFDKATGAEIDDDISWGPPPKVTGSFIVPADQEAKHILGRRVSIG